MDVAVHGGAAAGEDSLSEHGLPEICGIEVNGVKRHGNYKPDAVKRHPLYRCWCAMRARCYSKTNDAYPQYGGRGITVCDRWRDSFANFVSDMVERPAGMSLERKDNNGPYSPENCIWATNKQQSANTRQTKLITFNGESLPLREWARRLGIDKNSLKDRLKRWPLHEALTQPSDPARKRRFGA
jgi:hypothetical protein